MSYNEFNCETKGTANTSLLIDGGVVTGTIMAAKLGDGIFSTSTHEIFTPEQNRRFMACILGSDCVGGVFVGSAPRDDDKPEGPHNSLVGTSTLVALGAITLGDAIGNCFEGGRFIIEQPMTVQTALNERQLELLQLFKQGHALPAASLKMELSIERVRQYRNSLFSALGVKSVFSVVTAGYLSGVLPDPTRTLPEEQSL